MARKPKTLATNQTPEKADWYDTFLAKLRNTANVRLSCDAARIHRSTAYAHRKDNPEFSAAWDDALTEAVEALEAIAWNRATQKLAPSDTLLIFLLKAHAPNKYRERYDINHNSDLSKMSDEELRRIASGGKL